MQFPKRIDSRLLDRNVRKSLLLNDGLRCWVYPTEYAALFAMCTHEAESWNTNLLQLIFARGGIAVSPHGVAEYLLTTEKSEHYRNCAAADSNMHGLPWRCGEIQYGYKIPESEHYKGPSGWCFVPALALHNFLLDKSEMRNFISLTRAREEIKKLYATHGMVHWFEHDPVDHGRTLTMAVRVEDALRAITPDVLTQAHRLLETEHWRLGGCVAIERALTNRIGRVDSTGSTDTAARTISAVRLALNWVCGQWSIETATETVGTLTAETVGTLTAETVGTLTAETVGTLTAEPAPKAERGREREREGYPVRVEVGQFAKFSNEKQYQSALKMGNQQRGPEAEAFYVAYTAKRMELWDYMVRAIMAAHAAHAERSAQFIEATKTAKAEYDAETVGNLPAEKAGEE